MIFPTNPGRLSQLVMSNTIKQDVGQIPAQEDIFFSKMAPCRSVRKRIGIIDAKEGGTEPLLRTSSSSLLWYDSRRHLEACDMAPPMPKKCRQASISLRSSGVAKRRKSKHEIRMPYGGISARMIRIVLVHQEAQTVVEDDSPSE